MLEAFDAANPRHAQKGPAVTAPAEAKTTEIALHAVVRATRGYLGTSHDLLATIRDEVLPDPDKRRG